MIGCELGLAERASELRRSFDRSFAELPSAGEALTDDLLAIRVGADPYAVRLGEIRGLFSDRRITRLPNVAPELLGIAGFRGAIIPVFDLRRLLGYSAGDSPRWLVIASRAPVALAFDAFEAYLRLPREGSPSGTARQVPETRVQRTRPHVQEVVLTSEIVRPVVCVASIIEEIRRHSAAQ